MGNCLGGVDSIGGKKVKKAGSLKNQLKAKLGSVISQVRAKGKK